MNVDTIHKSEIQEPAHLNRSKGNNRLRLRIFTDNYTHISKKKGCCFCMCVCVSLAGENVLQGVGGGRERGS